MQKNRLMSKPHLNKLASEFNSFWLENKAIDLPPYGQFKHKKGLSSLYQLWEFFKENNKATRPAALDGASFLSNFGIDEWPEYAPLEDELIVAVESTINEHYNTVKSAKNINYVSKKHLIRPSSKFLRYTNILCNVGPNGPAIFKDDKVDPISMRLIKKSTLKCQSSKRIEYGMITYDRHGPKNICHFLYDVIGRYIDWITHIDETIKPTLIFPAGTIGQYHQYILRQLKIEHIEVKRNDVLYLKNLLVSTAITGDFAEGFAHPARIGDIPLLNTLQHKLRQGKSNKRLPKKIFLGRRHNAIRPLKNQEKIQAYLIKHGYQSIEMSNLAPSEQFSLFEHATHVIAIHGASLTSMITAHSHLKIIEYVHPTRATDAYAVISKSLGIEHELVEMQSANLRHPFDTTLPLEQLKMHFNQ